MIPAPVSPGPGTYESRAPTAEEDGVTLARLRRKETSAFASTSDRFNQSEGRATTAGSGGGRRAASAADRTMSNDEERPSRGGRVEVPPPGAYEVPDQWRRKRDPRRRTEAFISKETRFQEPKLTSVQGPGPGRYEAAQKLRNPIPVQRSSFQSGSARFESSVSVSPGPGMYESENPNASMVKRSFNVTVDGVMW